MLTSLSRHPPWSRHVSDSKRLGLGGHLIGQEGCRSLFEGMDRGALPCLEQLDLSANRIGESGVRACLALISSVAVSPERLQPH